MDDSQQAAPEPQVLELRRSMIILKAKEHSFRAAENFLVNRGWALQATTSIKELFMITLQKQPQFVMLPMDFPIEKIREIPQLLAQAVPVTVIGYAEGTSAAAMRLLSNSGLKYILIPPVTGPAVERIFMKVFKDMQKEMEMRMSAVDTTNNSKDLSIANLTTPDLAHLSTTDLNANSSASGSGFGPAGSQAGSSQQHSPGSTVVGSINSQADEYSASVLAKANSMLANIANGTTATGNVSGDPGAAGADGDLGAAKAPVPPGYGQTHTFGMKPSGLGQAVNPNAAKGQAGVQEFSNSNSMSAHSSANFANSNASGQSANLLPAAGGLPDAANAAQLQNLTPKSDRLNALAKFPANQNGLSAKGVSPGPGNQLPDAPSNSGQSSLLQVALPIKGDKLGTGGKNKNLLPMDPASKALMAQAAEVSLKESADAKGSASEAEKIGKRVDNVACILVDSPKFSGYLLAAMGDNRPLEDGFIEVVRARLLKFLVQKGEKVDEQDNLQLKIKEVPFEDWANVAAQFLRKSTHKNKEVALAFFPMARAVGVKTEVSKVPEMCAISIDDINEEVPLDYDAYIYLPVNDKYILYTEKGKRLYDQQKARLKTKGVGHIHVFKNEFSQAQKSTAEAYFNESIEAYTEDYSGPHKLDRLLRQKNYD